MVRHKNPGKQMSNQEEMFHQILQISQDVAVLRSQSDSARQDLNEIKYSLNGNGTPGMKTRIDRLEGSESRRVWLVRAATGSSIGAVIAAIGAWWKTGGG